MIPIKKFTEIIEKKDIEKWEREASNLSKNILRVNNFKDYIDIKESYRRWTDDFDSFVYKRVISSKEDYPNLRTKVWTFIRYVHGEMFESPYHNRHEYNFNQAYGKDLSRYPEEEKERIFESWKNNSKSIYQKYNRLKREAFQALYDFVGEASIDKGKEESFKIGPVNVKMIYDEKESSFENRKEAIDYIKEAITLLQGNKHVGKVLKGSELIYDEVDSVMESMINTIVAGYYIERDDLIVIRYLGDLQVVVHEYGHRYFKKFLPKAYREMWTDRLENNYVEINREMFAPIREAFWKSYNKHKGNDPYSLNVKPIWEDLPGFLDEFHRQLFESMTKVKRPTSGLPVNVSYEGKTYKDVAEHAIEFFEERILTEKRVNLSIVSDYGNTNPEEAFSDAFSYYVMGNKWKDKIPEEMLGMFYYIIK